MRIEQFQLWFLLRIPATETIDQLKVMSPFKCGVKITKLQGHWTVPLILQMLVLSRLKILPRKKEKGLFAFFKFNKVSDKVHEKPKFYFKKKIKP